MARDRRNPLVAGEGHSHLFLFSGSSSYSQIDFYNFYRHRKTLLFGISVIYLPPPPFCSFPESGIRQTVSTCLEFVASILTKKSGFFFSVFFFNGKHPG
jgi:hypothetical protein